MLNFFFMLFMAFACPKHTQINHNNGTTITAQDAGGDVGDNGHIPPGDTPPPPDQN